MAGRTQHTDVDRLPDPLLQYNFDLIFPRIPGSGQTDLVGFKTRIMTTSIPGRVIDPNEVVLKSVKKKFAGGVSYTQTLPFEALELRDMETRRTLERWHRYTRNNSGQGAYYSEYAVPAELHLFDDHNQVIEIIDLKGTWLESYDDAGLDGSASNSVTISGTLSYFTHDTRPSVA